MKAVVGAILACTAVSFLVPSTTLAQGLGLTGGDPNHPIEVTADNGIEWAQDRKLFTARGNAVATRGQVKVGADVLRAYYRPKPGQGGGTDIWRLDASGNVRITSPGESATGETAVYDIDNAVMVLRGRSVRYKTQQDEITANQQLEYWEAKQMAVARGNAYAVRGDRRLRADVLVAHFIRDAKKDSSRVHRVEAFDNVHVVTATGVVTADRAVYIVDTGIVTLTGNVKLTRDGNQLNGCSAEVNLKTGISKLFGCTKGPRVQGLILPNNVRKNKPK